MMIGNVEDSDFLGNIVQTIATASDSAIELSELKDSTEADLKKLVRDHIYTLLSKPTINEKEIQLLSALMQTVYIDLEED